jgi:aspartyl-tRNA(Asn)/glutamyl-tRNA(Gln) amidotransferase subunit A
MAARVNRGLRVPVMRRLETRRHDEPTGICSKLAAIMTIAGRFSDWADLTPDARDKLRAGATAHAGRLEPRLNAFVEIADVAPVQRNGPLGGMPYAAKDIFRHAGREPTGGFRVATDLGITGEADVLAQLDGGGGSRVGFTVLTELAYEPSGYNAARGRTRNPWNPDFITGGSSSGSAAAVAGGSAVVALGSDTGGSLRIPAHACGVTAWKPTYGAVSTIGAMALAPSLDTIGLLARSASDLMPALRVVADASLPKSPELVRRAVVLSDLVDAAEPPVRAACRDGIAAIESTGVAIVRRDGEAMLGRIDPAVLAVLQAEAARTHRALIEAPGIAPGLRKRLAKGLAIDDRALADSLSQRSALLAQFIDSVLGPADVAVLPVMAIRTPPAAECDPDAAAFSPRTLYELSRFTRFVNFLGLPAVALPVGFDDRGLPVALQMVGRPNADVALVALAEAVQRNTDWHGRIPSAVADLAAT